MAYKDYVEQVGAAVNSQADPKAKAIMSRYKAHLDGQKAGSTAFDLDTWVKTDAEAQKAENKDAVEAAKKTLKQITDANIAIFPGGKHTIEEDEKGFFGKHMGGILGAAGALIASLILPVLGLEIGTLGTILLPIVAFLVGDYFVDKDEGLIKPLFNPAPPKTPATPAVKLQPVQAGEKRILLDENNQVLTEQDFIKTPAKLKRVIVAVQEGSQYKITQIREIDENRVEQINPDVAKLNLTLPIDTDEGPNKGNPKWDAADVKNKPIIAAIDVFHKEVKASTPVKSDDGKMRLPAKITKIKGEDLIIAEYGKVTVKGKTYRAVMAGSWVTDDKDGMVPHFTTLALLDPNKPIDPTKSIDEQAVVTIKPGEIDGATEGYWKSSPYDRGLIAENEAAYNNYQGRIKDKLEQKLKDQKIESEVEWVRTGMDKVTILSPEKMAAGQTTGDFTIIVTPDKANPLGITRTLKGTVTKANAGDTFGFLELKTGTKEDGNPFNITPATTITQKVKVNLDTNGAIKVDELENNAEFKKALKAYDELESRKNGPLTGNFPKGKTKESGQVRDVIG